MASIIPFPSDRRRLCGIKYSVKADLISFETRARIEMAPSEVYLERVIHRLRGRLSTMKPDQVILIRDSVCCARQALYKGYDLRDETISFVWEDSAVPFKIDFASFALLEAEEDLMLPAGF